MSIEVLKPGILTTVQDSGRQGFQQYGVITSGAMDAFALRAANLLVGNDEHAGGLEMTIVGSDLAFEEDTVIAIAGADLSPTIDGQPVPLWRPILVHAGMSLKFGPQRIGCRCYVAIAGGIDVPVVMGSRSTYLRARIGGFQGRKLQSGDQLNVGKPSEIARNIQKQLAERITDDRFSIAPWFIPDDVLPYVEHDTIVRVLPGKDWDAFDADDLNSLLTAPFQVSPQSDRMGYRLDGPVRAPSQKASPMISAPVSFGTIQVPADGQPILLMADHQTTGGYPMIAHVISSDLPIVAQAAPGDELHFRQVTLREAEEQLLLQEMDLFMLKMGIQMRFRP